MKMRNSLMLIIAAAMTQGVFASEQLAQKAGCLACHARDQKLIGPSYKDVAAKYKGQDDAVAKLTEKVRKGGAGVWGQVPMPPHPPQTISDDDLKSLIEWVLKS